MAQATYRQCGDLLDYTPAAAVTGGDVVIVDGRVYVAPSDIAANVKGAVYAAGVFRGAKDASTFTEGDPVFWDADGDPVGGTAGSGAFSVTATGNTFAGYVIPGGGAATGVSTVDFVLSPNAAGGADGQGGAAVTSVAAAGSAQGDAASLARGVNTVSAADGTKGVILPAATAGAEVRVYNEHATNGLKVYPATGDDINDGTTNAAVTIEGKTLAIFSALDSTTWGAMYTANS